MSLFTNKLLFDTVDVTRLAWLVTVAELAVVFTIGIIGCSELLTEGEFKAGTITIDCVLVETGLLLALLQLL